MLVDFIIPTYNRIDSLRSMLSCLIAQTCEDWHAQVIYDGVNNLSIKKLIKSFNDSRIEYKGLDKRYNDFGHTPREVGKQQSKSKYIIMTGDDNYYMPTFVYELKIVIDAHNPGMIYWDMVHSHYEYQYFECRLAYNQIDMGAFATRRDIAQSIRLGNEYAADGIFVNEYINKYPIETIYKISKVLFVHN